MLGFRTQYKWNQAWHKSEVIEYNIEKMASVWTSVGFDAWYGYDYLLNIAWANKIDLLKVAIEEPKTERNW